MKSFIELEIERYKMKGLYNIPALILVFMIFYFPVTYGKQYWKEYIEPYSENYTLFYVVSVSLVHTGGATIYFLMFLPLYLVKNNEFFQNLRISKNSPWPWEEKNWK